MGKTLTFWMPLLFCPTGHIQVVITPFNLLGRQNVELLEKAGMKALGRTLRHGHIREFSRKSTLANLER